MTFAYLGCLLGGLACMGLLDWRFGLFWFADARRAAWVHGIGFVCFIAWDLLGIGFGVFTRGPSPYLSGIEIVPHLTLEELFFLAFLIWCTMVLYTGSARILLTLRKRPGDSGDRR